MHAILVRVRRVLGLDLPKRRLDLRFELTPPSRRGAAPRFSAARLMETLVPLKDRPVEACEHLLKQMRAANAYALSPGRRLAMAEAVLRAWYPLAYLWVQRFRAEAGIPDPPERQRQLDLIATLARILTNAFKLVLQHDYDGSRFHYARHRARVYLCAFRILELVCFEQRVCGLRYRPLSPRAWQDANTVFQVMLACESVDFPLPRLDNQRPGRPVVRTANLRDLYAAIQIYSLLDYTTWPVEQHEFLDSYRESIDQAVTLTWDASGDREPDRLIAYCYQNHPPLRTRDPAAIGPAVAIQYRVLAQHIRQDYRDLLQAKARNNSFLVPRALAPLKDAYQLAIGSLLQRNIQHEIWTGPGDPVGHPIREFHIYVSFEEIEQHLQRLFHEGRTPRERRTLADALARRSAHLGEDQTANEESRWHVLRSDPSVVRLRTQETRFTVPLRIGSLVAYGIDEADLHRPRLGFIARIWRGEPGVVILDMERLARFAEPVRVRKAPSQPQTDAPSAPSFATLPAFLVFDQGFGWGILLPRQDLLWEASPVQMQWRGRMLHFALGQARTLSQNFYLFGVPTEVGELATPDYPQSTERPT